MFLVEYAGGGAVRLCSGRGGGSAVSCEGERLQEVVRGGEERDCGNHDVYAEVAGHSLGGRRGMGSGWEAGGGCC